jgi:hypothetical protein
MSAGRRRSPGGTLRPSRGLEKGGIGAEVGSVRRKDAEANWRVARVEPTAALTPWLRAWCCYGSDTCREHRLGARARHPAIGIRRPRIGEKKLPEGS